MSKGERISKNIAWVNQTKPHGARKVEAAAIQYALARRPGTSWQALGKQLKLNPEDLRRAVEAHERGQQA